MYMYSDLSLNSKQGMAIVAAVAANIWLSGVYTNS